uniref:CUB domain-containing protein n=1 Tax=Trichobilharzia regenti TaxID=157069 RepID=A0AA85KK65_TRIRE|nr:unnamed protein product [Trichobilharzia regenti]
MFNKYSFITYDIEYRFVYDYGVNKSHGKQISPDCDFSFHSSTSKSGFFTSPNYPGLYPVDIICEYRLVGYQNEVIDLEFQEFDVESNSVRCSTDGDGDYVEVRSCSTLSILDLGRKYYCQNVGQYKNNTIRINWRKSCLIIKFFSNNMIVRHGFLATYRFSISGANSLRGGNSGRLIQLSLLCLTFIHFCVFKTLQMKPLNSV